MLALIPYWAWLALGGATVGAVGAYELTKTDNPPPPSPSVPVPPPVRGNAGISASIDWKGILAVSVAAAGLVYAVRR